MACESRRSLGEGKIEYDATFFLVAIPAVIFAGISKGGFGSGAAFAATPLLALVLPPDLAVGILLPVLMLIDAATLRPYWRRWVTSDALRLIAGGVPGIVLAALFWRVANADVLRFLIGVVALGFVAFQGAWAMGWVGAERRGAGPVFGLVMGAVAGFTSFISHAGGPPAAVYLLARGVTKTEYQATTVLVFTVMNIVKAVPYSFLGIFSAQSLTAAAFLAPAAVVGAWLGVVAHRAIPERAYFAVTYTLLVLTGSKLIFDAVV